MRKNRDREMDRERDSDRDIERDHISIRENYLRVVDRHKYRKGDVLGLIMFRSP